MAMLSAKAGEYPGLLNQIKAKQIRHNMPYAMMGLLAASGRRHPAFG